MKLFQKSSKFIKPYNSQNNKSVLKNQIKSGLNNEKEYHKIREIISMQKINMEKALIKFKLKNEQLKHESKSLSIFNEETKDTIFMCELLIFHKKLFKLKLFKVHLKFLIKVIPSDTNKSKMPSYYSALLPYEDALMYGGELEMTCDEFKMSTSDLTDTNHKVSESLIEMEA